MQAMAAGDDATLRVVIALFEEFGFTVVGVEAVAPALLPGPGVLAGTITDRDKADAARAAEIVAALGRGGRGAGRGRGAGPVPGGRGAAGDGRDAGRGCRAEARPAARPCAGRGVCVYKAAKPGQDRRIDLPTIGPDTLRAVAAAGLGGVAFQAGAVICLDLAEMQRLAGDLGLFLWARE